MRLQWDIGQKENGKKMKNNDSLKKETYILYESVKEGSYIFFQKDDLVNHKNLPSDAVEIWSTQAASFEIAQMKKHEFLGWEPYKPMILEDADLLAYLPKNKFDIENASLLRNLGYPTIKPVMKQLLEWLQDMNWPVARFIADWIIHIGVDLYPYFEEIFESKDGFWKYWLLIAIIDKMPTKDARFFTPLLEKLSLSKNDYDTSEGVPKIAEEILFKMGQG